MKPEVNNYQLLTNTPQISNRHCPYPVFGETNERQRNAVLDFVAKGRASGNMYPVGNSVCAWYAGWMAAALAAISEKTEPIKLLDEAAAGAGCFGDLFEINEAKVSMHPWFATASGNVVYALNQMLVQNRGNEIHIAAGAPTAWKDYAFKLACHGNLVVEVEVKNGQLAKLTLVPGDATVEHQRTLVIPGSLFGEEGSKRITIRFNGKTDIIGDKK
ncbi:MAG: hypothetical protein FJ395_03675 [Verrucomicrobia bacterium]|nr:hypothetical protein [Verrucomicrobiota bacterium]